MNFDELQAFVAELSAEDFQRFARWFEDHRANRWNERIEADICAGRLDEIGRRADEDFETGRCTPLP